MTPENVELLIQFAGVALVLWILFGGPIVVARDKKDDKED